MEKIDYSKKCIICNKEFVPTGHKSTATCSKECLGIHIKNVRKKMTENGFSIGRKKIITINKCIVCEKDFNPGKHKEKLTCSKECLKTHQNNTKEDRIKKSKNALIEKYGVDHASKIPGHIDKVKKTKLEKYGDENYNNREQAKETTIEKYGVEHILQLDEFINKAKHTKETLYGDENYNNRDQAKKTSIEKFGVEHHLQLPEYMDKQKQTNLKKYGSEFVFLSDDARKKLTDYNLEKFGTEFFFSSKEYLEDVRNKKIEKLKKIFEENELEFDFEKYTKSRERNENGKTFSYILYDIKCKKCNEIFSTKIQYKIPICRNCYPIASNSVVQFEFEDFIKNLNIEYRHNDITIIKPFELDVVIEKYNLAFEINGNYYHSELGGEKDKYYHLMKSQLCEEKGIKLIHIFEDEWLFKKDIVKSRIKNMLQKTDKKIYGRSCEIKEIDNKNKDKFLYENHIQGNSIDKIRLGLYYENNLVSLMTFGKRRNALGAKSDSSDEYELIRFCNESNTNVLGAFSKLFSYFVKNYNPKKIITYADIRWSGTNYKNTVYYKNGFTFIDYTKPSYFYVEKKDYLNRYHRFSYRKDVLLKLFPESLPEKSEWQIAMKNGFDRIWDCGTMKFEWNSIL